MSDITQVVVTGATGVRGVAGTVGSTFTFHNDFLLTQDEVDLEAAKILATMGDFLIAVLAPTSTPEPEVRQEAERKAEAEALELGMSVASLSLDRVREAAGVRTYEYLVKTELDGSFNSIQRMVRELRHRVLELEQARGADLEASRGKGRS